MTRKSRASLGLPPLIAAALALAAPAAAHPGDWNLDVIITASLAREEPTAAPSLTIDIENRAPGALTLNGAAAPFGRKLSLERRRSFFGFETWQPVRHLLVTPGGAAHLGPPEYRWRADAAAMADLAKPGAALTAFFSPIGRVVVRLGPAGQASLAPPPPGQAPSTQTAPQTAPRAAPPLARPCPPGLEGLDGGC